jgi:hypothetical protein
MNSTTYDISSPTVVLHHFWPRESGLSVVRDEAEDAEMLRRARIRSGDYLTTLTTELERVAQSLRRSKSPEAAELERIVAELLYLERNYKITEQ